MFGFEGADRRKEEERVREEGRLPPGQSLTLKFPVLHYGPVPAFNPATWDFRVWGEVDEEKRWSWAEFNQLPRSKIQMDIHCVTRWSKFNTTSNSKLTVKPYSACCITWVTFGLILNKPFSTIVFTDTPSQVVSNLLQRVTQ